MKKYLLWCVALLPSLLLVGLYSTGHIVFENAPPQGAVAEKSVADSLDELKKLRAGVNARLERLEKMTEKEWQEEGKKMGDKAKLRAPSLKEALARNQKALEELDKKIAAGF